jgi:hypothetical protein
LAIGWMPALQQRALGFYRNGKKGKQGNDGGGPVENLYDCIPRAHGEAENGDRMRG